MARRVIVDRRRRELRAPAGRKGIPHFASLLASGTITRNDFVRETANDYAKLAKRLYGMWALPNDVEITDVTQELYASTFEHLAKWNPVKAPIGRFLVWNANADTAKILHRLRGAKNGHQQSQHARGIDDVFVRNDGEEPVEPGDLMPSAPNQYQAALVREVLRKTSEPASVLAILFEDDDDPTSAAGTAALASAREEFGDGADAAFRRCRRGLAKLLLAQ